MADGFEYVRSATVTETTSHSDITNPGFDGVVFIIDITNVDGGGTYDFKIQGKDPISGNYYDLLASGDIAGGGVQTLVLEVHPAITEASGLRASRILPTIYRLHIEEGGVGPTITYSVYVIQV